MNRRVAYPFLTLSDNALIAGKWHVKLDDDEWKPVREFLPDWDANASILLRRRVVLNPEIAANDLRMDTTGQEFALNVRLGTGQGRLPRLILDRDSRRLDRETHTHVLEFTIPGAMLSVVLDIRTEVLLVAPVSSGGPLSPQKLGDRIWSDDIRIKLEGEEPRFPIEIADFRSLLGNTTEAAAPWYLHWSPHDWNRDFHGSIRLYLNQEYPEFIQKVEDQDRLTLQAMLADVIGQICERFVLEAEVGEFNAFETGSLGAQAMAWLNKVWPSRDLQFVRSVLIDRPGVFRAGFLALAELGEA